MRYVPLLVIPFLLYNAFAFLIFEEPAADFRALRPHRIDRALPMLLRAEPAVVGRIDLDLRPVLAPEEAAAGDVGVERAHEHRDPGERDAVRHQPPADLVEHVLRLAHARSAGVEPVDDRRDVQIRVSHRLDSMAPGRSGKLATNGGRCSFVMSSPFASPHSPPADTPAATARRLFSGDGPDAWYIPA